VKGLHSISSAISRARPGKDFPYTESPEAQGSFGRVVTMKEGAALCGSRQLMHLPTLPKRCRQSCLRSLPLRQLKKQRQLRPRTRAKHCRPPRQRFRSLLFSHPVL